MATNRHAQIRYNTLDKCFRNPGRNYTIEDLLEACNKAIFEFDSNSKGIKRRQLFDDIRYMESSQGWSIELEENLKTGRRRVYRYEDINFSINNQPLNESDANQLKVAIFSLARMENSWADELSVRLKENFKMKEDPRKIIEFEENEFLKGKDFISELYNAIFYKKVLKIEYKSFKSIESQILELHPYYLKQFNNRWFVFGQVDDYTNLTNLALDRIENLKESNDNYVETDIDFNEYFEDFVGVSNSSDPLQKIILRIDTDQWPYIKTKPLHGSQKLMRETENYTEISIEVKPNIELENMLLQFGEKIEVISPKEFRNSLSERIKSSYWKYFK